MLYLVLISSITCIHASIAWALDAAKADLAQRAELQYSAAQLLDVETNRSNDIHQEFGRQRKDLSWGGIGLQTPITIENISPYTLKLMKIIQHNDGKIHGFRPKYNDTIEAGNKIQFIMQPKGADAKFCSPLLSGAVVYRAIDPHGRYKTDIIFAWRAQLYRNLALIVKPKWTTNVLIKFKSASSAIPSDVELKRMIANLWQTAKSQKIKISEKFAEDKSIIALAMSTKPKRRTYYEFKFIGKWQQRPVASLRMKNHDLLLSRTEEPPKCIICMEATPDYMVVPCNHKQFCQRCISDCKKRNQTCPTCQGSIQEIQKVYE